MATVIKTNGKEIPKGIEDRFAAAVNVIRGLPKNGNFKKRINNNQCLM